jgi:hypothetical protein
MTVKNKKVVKIGARVLGVKKAEALAGRADNLQHKSNFRAGGTAKLTRFPDGPLLPLPTTVAKPVGNKKGNRNVE